MDKAPDVETKYLDGLMGERKKIKIYIHNGYCFEGKILEHDESVILLEETLGPDKKRDRLIYKVGVSNVVPFS